MQTVYHGDFDSVHLNIKITYSEIEYWYYNLTYRKDFFHQYKNKFEEKNANIVYQQILFFSYNINKNINPINLLLMATICSFKKKHLFYKYK